MNAHLFVFTVFCFVSSFTYSMDFPEKPKSTVEAWLQLACDLREGKIGLFHTLPSDIQGRIFAQIHPRQSLDEWSSDNAMCVREILVPHHICSFDVAGDHMAYFAKKDGYIDAYDPHYLDLDYGHDRTLCEKGLNGCYGDAIPSIALCGDKIIYEGHKKDLWYMDKNGDGRDIGYIKLNDDVFAWACHPTLSLCVAVTLCTRGTGNSKVYIFTMQKDGPHIKKYDHIFVGSKISYLQWEYNRKFLTLTDNKNGFYLINEEKGEFYSWSRDFKGNSYFSFNGDSVVVKRVNNEVFKHKILKYKSNDNYIHTSDHPHCILRGFGESMFLMETADENGKGDNTFIMKSKNANDIKMTSFSGCKGLHRLPRNHDYRYITIEPSVNKYDATKTDSKISLFVPGSTVCFQHYCMMQALMEADKSENAVDMDLFKKPELKNLVDETAAHYAFFKKKMS